LFFEVFSRPCRSPPAPPPHRGFNNKTGSPPPPPPPFEKKTLRHPSPKTRHVLFPRPQTLWELFCGPVGPPLYSLLSEAPSTHVFCAPNENEKGFPPRGRFPKNSPLPPHVPPPPPPLSIRRGGPPGGGGPKKVGRQHKRGFNGPPAPPCGAIFWCTGRTERPPLPPAEPCPVKVAGRSRAHPFLFKGCPCKSPVNAGFPSFPASAPPIWRYYPHLVNPPSRTKEKNQLLSEVPPHWFQIPVTPPTHHPPAGVQRPPFRGGPLFGVFPPGPAPAEWAAGSGPSQPSFW